MHAADLLSQRANLTPERLALVEVDGARRYTYAELNRRVNRSANFLRGLGLQPGQRVSILAHNSVVYLDLLYGLAKLGAIFAPLNWRLTSRELGYIVGDCEPSILIVGPEFVNTLGELRPSLAGVRMLTVAGAKIEGALDYEAGLAAASDQEPERPALTGEEPLCLLYTSGTTGRPKGAIIPQRQVVWNCINTVISWGLNQDDSSPVLTPLFHSGGLFAFLTPILYVGGTILLARGFDAETSLRLIAEQGCTVILGVPTLFQMWQNTPAFGAADLSRVRFFISGGAPCPPALMDAWRRQKGVRFRQGFGLTEVGVNCFSMTDEDAVTHPGAVGKPIFHSRMRLTDPASGADAAAGEAGELLIQGPHVCLGYWRNPEATAEAFRGEPGGWFHTGDMARQDADGFYYIAGRYKDMIKSGGENVYAAEVESVFREHPAVADAALIGQPDEKWGEVGLMIVMLKPGAAADPGELLDLCAARLARYKVPKRIIFDSLPYSPYGKVIKAELRQKHLP